MKSLLFVPLAMLLLSVAASADVMEITIPFDPGAVRIDANGFYTAPRFEGMSLIESEGQPCLPTLPVRIALPEGCAATSIEAVDAVYGVIQGEFRISPAGPLIPLSMVDGVVPSQPDPSIYMRDAFFPSDACMLNSSGAVWGIPIAYATIYPVRWNPSTLELEVLQYLTLEVEYAPDPSVMLIERRAASSEAAAVDLARRIVVNPQDVSGSGSALVPERDLEFGQYVIIAPPGFEGQLAELAAWKTAKGVPAEVYSTIWIDAQYDGYDLQQKIRAFLADCRDEGTDWVLLFGDDDILPARDVTLTGQGGDEAPSDLYFSDINDTGVDLWDMNGNHVWGESTDEVDFHPDLWTGRASVSTAAEAQIFVDKVMIYEAVPSALDYFETAPREMRVGYSTGILWEGYSGAASAEIISGYLPGIEWEEERCYEETGNSEQITIDMINAGPHHVYHASHGGPTLMYTSYGSCYTVEDIMAQTNISSGHLPAIWNSIACDIGELDDYECCGDAWLASPNGGGFGAFNSRYGYGHYGEPGYGPSERLCERFYYEHFVNDVIALGQAHLAAMDHFTPPTAWADSFDVQILEHCLKEYNLFGDPEVMMWTESAQNLTLGHPSSIPGNTEVTINVTSGGSPVENARVCIQKGDDWRTCDIYEVGFTDASGNVTLYAGPESVGDIVVTATAHNFVPCQGIITVTELGIGGGDGAVGVLSIGAVRPCPATGTASLSFSTPSAGPAIIEAFDLAGRVVSTVFSGDLDAGTHGMTWDFTRNDGSLLPSGIYWLRLTSGGGSAAAQAVLLR